jgi:hypothetical protein
VARKVKPSHGLSILVRNVVGPSQLQRHAEISRLGFMRHLQILSVGCFRGFAIG